MKKILFTNTYSFTPMVGAITKINPEEIYLIIDKKPDEHQKEAKEKLKNTFKHIKFKEIKTSVYEVYEIAKEIIKEIDKVYNEDINEIYIDITSGRKTKSIGIMLGCYARSNKIKEILYFTQEINKMISIPKLSFEINKNAYDLLSTISKKKITLSELANSNNKKLGRTAVYNNIRDFKEKGLVNEINGNLSLTDYGKLILL
ncbi:MAG: CRISPR-associated CARF protein Csa3 [Candidatus ainarchaeum sp.]|nr:CRISPR-associated CARF protein Csa3 [Candidatus ainarchaeum sp.]